jgi:hypothetical protein
MKLGIWFSTHPTAVVPTYLSSDLLTINATSKFDDVSKWRLVTQDIDFCVITIRNHRNLPGIDEEIKKFVDELKTKDIDVYLAFSCLLRPVGGVYRYLGMVNK